MVLTRLNIANCRGCAWVFSYDPEDIQVVAHGIRYRLFCPHCRAEYRIDPSIYHTLYPNGRPVAEKEKPQEKQKKDTKVEEYREALEAQDALHKHRTQIKAAAALGISVTTLRKRLKQLPVEATAGER